MSCYLIIQVKFLCGYTSLVTTAISTLIESIFLLRNIHFIFNNELQYPDNIVYPESCEENL
jgi:hypothetical protein